MSGYVTATVPSTYNTNMLPVLHHDDADDVDDVDSVYANSSQFTTCLTHMYTYAYTTTTPTTTQLFPTTGAYITAAGATSDHYGMYT